MSPKNYQVVITVIIMITKTFTDTREIYSAMTYETPTCIFLAKEYLRSMKPDKFQTVV